MAIDHRRDRRLRLRAPGLPRRDHLALGEPDTVPDRIEVTSRFLERAGDPWFPVTGEIHFSRISRSRWPEVLGHARAGGLDSVATYVFWQAHEPTPGVFRWDGDLDLRAFIELAQTAVSTSSSDGSRAPARPATGLPDWLMVGWTPTRSAWRWPRASTRRSSPSSGDSRTPRAAPSAAAATTRGSSGGRCAPTAIAAISSSPPTSRRSAPSRPSPGYRSPSTSRTRPSPCRPPRWTSPRGSPSPGRCATR